jgi:rhodanese-related sulfurtransferase/rubrerythrin
MDQLAVPEAREWLEQRAPGSVEVLDVRQAWEYEELHLPGARLIPLGELAKRWHELAADRPVVVYCRTGVRSRAAAQFLSGQGRDRIFNLQGGILAWQGHLAEGAPDLGMDIFLEIESLEDIFFKAYGMERFLQGCYGAFSQRSEDVVVQDLFDILAGFEDKHMRTIYSLYCREVDAPLNQEDFALRAPETTGEGGVAPQSFVPDEEYLLRSIRAACELAMAIEVQAMDFYLRCARRAGEEKVASVFLRLAREEQGHLRMLENYFDNNLQS